MGSPFRRKTPSFSQEEISSIILGFHHLQSIGLWFPFVDHCVAKMDEDMGTITNEILEDFDEAERFTVLVECLQ